MHTRYAPVRHSHPPEGGIPSDLHVLGLPLAFILSQDQTLRCNIVLLLVLCIKDPVSMLIWTGRLKAAAFPRRRLTTTPSLVLASDFQRASLPNLPRAVPVSCPKAGAKVRLFPLPATLFSNFFSRNLHRIGLQRNKNAVFSGQASERRPVPGREGRSRPPPRPKKAGSGNDLEDEQRSDGRRGKGTRRHAPY